MKVAKSVTIENLEPDAVLQSATGSPEIKAWIRGVPPAGAKVKLYLREAPALKREDFSIVVLPDTQFYSGSNNPETSSARPDIFNNQTDWIVNNRASHNIAFVAHVGDIVLSGDDVRNEWTNAANAMYRLENPLTTGMAEGIPYSICVGNHDGVSSNYKFFNQYFGINRFAGRSYYGGHFGASNENHYSLFTAGGMEFIVLSLEYLANRKPEVMEWANQVLSSNRNRRAIVLNHSLMLGWEWSAEGQEIYNALKTNPNLFLMLCGHAPVYGHRSDSYQGNTVTTILSDYSNHPNGGNGWMRIMKFSLSKNQIEVKTFSPWLNEYRSSSGHEFTIPYNMRESNISYKLASSATLAADGVVEFGNLKGLVPLASYEWYVSVEVEGQAHKGPQGSFLASASVASSNPSFAVTSIKMNQSGHPEIRWNTMGGGRYRVEFSDGGPEWKFMPILRPDEDEIAPAPLGTASEMTFVDDGSMTDGLPAKRFYRIMRMAAPQPLRIIKISKPANRHPAILWTSVGGRRYRVQYSDGNPMVFKDIVRPAIEETDSAIIGTGSYQSFEDDGSLTGGPAPARFYRVYELK